MVPELRLLSTLLAWATVTSGFSLAPDYQVYNPPAAPYSPDTGYPSSAPAYPSGSGYSSSAPAYPSSSGYSSSGPGYPSGSGYPSSSSSYETAPQYAPAPSPTGGRCLVLLGSTEVTRPTNNYGPPTEVVDRKICVTREMVDEAFAKAQGQYRAQIAGQYGGQYGSTPSYYNATDTVNEDIVGELGQVLLTTSMLLASKLGLTRAQAKDLGMIPTEATAIGRACPAFFHETPRQQCPVTRYRTHNGWCNNLQHPAWGATFTRVKRFLPALYYDGLNGAVSDARGSPIPNARMVSWFLHQDEGRHGLSLTTFFTVWGQLIDHDVVNTATYENKGSKDHSLKCCPSKEGRVDQHPDCWPISISPRDPFYSQFGHTCMNFVRSRPGVNFDCRLGPREQLNAATSYIDASFVYGSERETALGLRTFSKGQLKFEAGILGSDWKHLLPLNRDRPDVSCFRPNANMFCFVAGDERVNIQLPLVVIQTLFLRFHNDLAQKLSYVNPHWDDERLYQEARRIVGAFTQHVTYNEFLPALVGKRVMDTYGLTLQQRGWWNGYDPSVEGVTWSEFATAAFRVGHTYVPGQVHAYSYNNRFVQSWNLRDLMNQPFELYAPGRVDWFTMGMANQLADAYDTWLSVDMNGYIFQAPGKKFGKDLASLNIHRGRDHGIRGYVFYRQLCGLSPVESFNDLFSIMDNRTASIFSQIYKDVRHIDLWTGLINEKVMDGAGVGPTIACLLGNQFKDLRWGDRFWYENPGWPSSFSLPQLDEIRKATLAMIVCDYGDRIEAIQRFPMQLPNYEWNRRVSCQSAEIPRIDLRKWKEVPRYPAARAPPPQGY